MPARITAVIDLHALNTLRAGRVMGLLIIMTPEGCGSISWRNIKIVSRRSCVIDPAAAYRTRVMQLSSSVLQRAAWPRGGRYVGRHNHDEFEDIDFRCILDVIVELQVILAPEVIPIESCVRQSGRDWRTTGVVRVPPRMYVRNRGRG